MRPKENYTPYLSAAFGLTITILIVFQIYNWREPARIDRQEDADRAAAVEAGGHLYGLNCASCHGANGEGGIGPALNSRELLKTITDPMLFSLIRSGIPGSVMPAWGQVFGGPLTDEQTSQLVAYIRGWEATAPEITPLVQAPDPVNGASIYGRTCFVCHGENGMGTERAPALNDPTRLSRLDDTWYRNTIAHGRPALGMPTWGTVLSPQQINDLVALIGAWRAGETVTAEISLATLLSDALFAIRDFDQADAEFYLNTALTQADEAQAQEIRAIIELVQQNQLFVAESRIATLLPPQEMGQALYTSNCSACHGETGTGGVGPNLHANAYVQSQNDADLIAFLLSGREGTAMRGFDGILAEDELQNVVILLRFWQEE